MVVKLYGSNIVRTLLTISGWCFGMGILEFPAGRQHHILSFLHSTVCLLGYYYVVYVSYYYEYRHIIKLTETTTTTMTILFYGNLLIATSSIILGWKRSKDIGTCSVKADALYNLLTKVGITDKDCKQFCNTVWPTINHFLILLVIVIVNSLNVFKQNTPWNALIFAIIALNYPLLLMIIAEATFLFTIRSNGELLKALNTLLSNAITASNDSPQHKRIISRNNAETKLYSESTSPNGKSMDIKTMRTIKNCHLELVKICLDAAASYGMQILLTVVLAFAVITGVLYNAYQLLFQAKLPTDVLIKGIMICACWFFYYVLTIINFCSICNNVSNEALKTGDIICNLYDEITICPEVRIEIRNFTLQMIQNPLTFTALGFFSLNNSLIHGMAGSITTYLVILIQLSGITEKRNQESPITENITASPIDNFLDRLDQIIN